MMIELIVLTRKVVDDRQICSEQEFFRVGGIERALDGAFGTTHEAIDDFMELCEEFVRGFVECC